MRISAKGEYAILAILDLVQTYGSDKVKTLEEISNKESIPHPFLVQILLELKRAGFVDSKRGAGGGYRIARHPRDINIGEVLRLIDGPILPFKCSLPIPEENIDCAHYGNCVLSSVWDDVRTAVENVVESITFEELDRRRSEKNLTAYSI